MKLPEGDYYTIEEMALLEGLTPKTVYQRIFRAGEKPVAPDALYTEDSYNAIKGSAGPGRPKKAAEPEGEGGKEEGEDA